MQVARTNISAQVVGKAPVDAPTRINTAYAPLYLTTSLGNTSFDLEDLENIALDRLRVLKAAARARTESLLGTQGTGGGGGNPPGSTGGKIEAIRNSIRKAEKLYGLNVPNSIGSAQARSERETRIMKDEASHFLIRLALCRTHEQRQWVSKTECDLFNARLEFTGVEFALHALSKVNDAPNVEAVGPTEMERFRTQLDAVARGPCRNRAGIDFTSAKFFKTNFEQVPSLIRSRRVFVHQGNVYVPERNVMDIVGQQFRARLNGGLMTASKAGIVAEADARMRLILESVRQHFTAETSEETFDPNAKRDKVDTISVNELNESVSCMPLCMRHMMHKLRENHHLRHSARMQLGVFLKGCGLTMDESLRFWKAEFGKGDITSDKFEKNYAYNIRHHYGKEGKRKNLNPFPCIKIINERPGPGEHNGCPYREMQSIQLTQALRATGVDPNSIGSIVEKAGAGNFQLACGMCFSATQPGPHEIAETGLPGYVPNHPNEYFIEARRRQFGKVAEPQSVIDDELDDEALISATEAAMETTGEATDPTDAATKDVAITSDEAEAPNQTSTADEAEAANQTGTADIAEAASQATDSVTGEAEAANQISDSVAENSEASNQTSVVDKTEAPDQTSAREKSEASNQATDSMTNQEEAPNQVS